MENKFKDTLKLYNEKYNNYYKIAKTISNKIDSIVDIDMRTGVPDLEQQKDVARETHKLTKLKFKILLNYKNIEVLYNEIKHDLHTQYNLKLKNVIKKPTVKDIEANIKKDINYVRLKKLKEKYFCLLTFVEELRDTDLENLLRVYTHIETNN